MRLDENIQVAPWLVLEAIVELYELADDLNYVLCGSDSTLPGLIS
jgi:hypothetical protein